MLRKKRVFLFCGFWDVFNSFNSLTLILRDFHTADITFLGSCFNTILEYFNAYKKQSILSDLVVKFICFRVSNPTIDSAFLRLFCVFCTVFFVFFNKDTSSLIRSCDILSRHCRSVVYLRQACIFLCVSKHTPVMGLQGLWPS